MSDHLTSGSAKEALSMNISHDRDIIPTNATEYHIPWRCAALKWRYASVNGGKKGGKHNCEIQGIGFHGGS